MLYTAQEITIQMMKKQQLVFGNGSHEAQAREGGARGFSLTWRYPEFSTFTKRTTVSFYTQEGKTIWNIVGQLYGFCSVERRCQASRCHCFSSQEESTGPPLFDGSDSTQKVHEGVDRINNLFGEYSILRATMLFCMQHHWVISPAHGPHKSYPYRRS